jgi:O-antigen/teichoic acid export membrane protein
MKIINRLISNNNTKSFIGYSFFSLIYILTIVILARTYSQENFGIWMIFLESSFLMQVVMNGFFSSALIRFLSIENNETDAEKLIGSNWLVSIIVTFSSALIIYLFLLIFYHTIITSSFKYVFIFLPVFSLCQLPAQNLFSILQARNQLVKLYLLKCLQIIIFAVFVMINFFIFKLDVLFVIFANILSVLVISTISFKSAKFSSIKKYDKIIAKKLINFSKFTLMTNIGGSLLKSSDIYIIGILLTNVEVAVYSIPLKLIDAYNVPLNCFSIVAYPMISRLSSECKVKVRKAFYTYSVLLTAMFFPVLILMFIFAKEMIYLFGGQQYVTDQTIDIFRIFVVFGFFLPIDRFTGITLDSANKPQYNFIKVKIMLLLNIIGDIVAIKYFNSLIGISIATLLTGIIGVIFGLFFLNKEIGIKFNDMFRILDFRKSFSNLFLGDLKNNFSEKTENK